MEMNFKKICIEDLNRDSLVGNYIKDSNSAETVKVINYQDSDFFSGNEVILEREYLDYGKTIDDDMLLRNFELLQKPIEEEKDYIIKCLKEEKKEMSEQLYEYMLKDYKRMSKKEILKKYQEEVCRCCRFNDYDTNCEYLKEDDLYMPIRSENDFIPGRKSCGNFKWD